jgi:hypothetical protein
MNASEVIIFDGVSPEIYQKIADKAVRYAMISLPFTFNRMVINDSERRIQNIAKGKIAELLFRYYCHVHQIPADFERCTTPFWSIDQRDFILAGKEWDIKNNFFHPKPGITLPECMTGFPALIPNHHAKDQWTKRNTTSFNSSAGVGYVFTFMPLTKAGSLTGNAFFEIILSDQTKAFINNLCKEYAGKKPTKQPFDETWFWEQAGIINDQSIAVLHDFPALYITGYVSSDQFYLFKNTGKDHVRSEYVNFNDRQWYVKDSKKLNFMNGMLFTTITNATCPVGLLPAFADLVGITN